MFSKYSDWLQIKIQPIRAIQASVAKIYVGNVNYRIGSRYPTNKLTDL